MNRAAPGRLSFRAAHYGRAPGLSGVRNASSFLIAISFIRKQTLSQMDQLGWAESGIRLEDWGEADTLAFGFCDFGITAGLKIV